MSENSLPCLCLRASVADGRPEVVEITPGEPLPSLEVVTAERWQQILGELPDDCLIPLNSGSDKSIRKVNQMMIPYFDALQEQQKGSTDATADHVS